MIRGLLVGTITFLVVGYLGILGYFYFTQRSYQYINTGPVTALAATKLTGAGAVAIPTTGGATVNGWYEAPQAGKPVILFYKGNWGSFGDEHERYEAWTAAGFGFLAFDYRGFPASPGEITQQHILDDAISAYDWLRAKGFPIVVWGRSLGSGPATYVSSERTPDALLLETPFLSAADVAKERYWYLPIDWVMLDQFPLKQWILAVKAPVFVAHGTSDHTIDVHNGRAVYDLAPNKYGLWIVDGADHSDLWARGIWDKAEPFYLDVEAKKAGVAGK
jgi:uncharacterized protein